MEEVENCYPGLISPPPITSTRCPRRSSYQGEESKACLPSFWHEEQSPR